MSIARSSQVSLVPSPSPQFVRLNRQKGKAAAVTIAVDTGERGDVVAINRGGRVLRTEPGRLTVNRGGRSLGSWKEAGRQQSFAVGILKSRRRKLLTILTWW